MKYRKYAFHNGNIYEDATYQVKPDGAGNLGTALANAKREGDASGKPYNMSVRGNDIDAGSGNDTVPISVTARSTEDAASKIKKIQSETPNIQDKTEYHVDITNEGYNVRMSYGSLKKLLGR